MKFRSDPTKPQREHSRRYGNFGPEEIPSDLWEPESVLGSLRRAVLNYGGVKALTAADAARHLGMTTRQAVSKRRIGKRLLGLPYNGRVFLYPAWQFDMSRTDQLVYGLAEILAFAPADDPWGLASLLTSPQPALDDEVPIAVLGDPAIREAALEEIVALIGDVYSIAQASVDTAREQSRDYVVERLVTSLRAQRAGKTDRRVAARSVRAAEVDLLRVFSSHSATTPKRRLVGQWTPAKRHPRLEDPAPQLQHVRPNAAPHRSQNSAG